MRLAQLCRCFCLSAIAEVAVQGASYVTDMSHLLGFEYAVMCANADKSVALKTLFEGGCHITQASLNRAVLLIW